MTIKTLSAHQQAIMTALTSTSDNLSIEAAAGAGKTSTLEHAIRHALPKGAQALYVVFNKRNQEEACERLEGTSAMTCTLNALGFRAMAAGSKKRYNLSQNKVWDVIREVLTKSENKIYGKTVKHMVDLARSEGIGAKVLNPATGKVELFDMEPMDGWMAVIERYEISCDDGEQNMYDAITFARKVLAECIRWSVELKIIDFNDQNYMPATGLVPLTTSRQKRGPRSPCRQASIDAASAKLC